MALSGQVIAAVLSIASPAFCLRRPIITPLKSIFFLSYRYLNMCCFTMFIKRLPHQYHLCCRLRTVVGVGGAGSYRLHDASSEICRQAHVSSTWPPRLALPGPVLRSLAARQRAAPSPGRHRPAWRLITWQWQRLLLDTLTHEQLVTARHVHNLFGIHF